MALLFAIALAAAGYSLLLAVRKAPVGAGDPATMTRIPVLPDPTRLPRRQLALPASSGREQPRAFPLEQRTVTFAVTELPEALRGTAGVAVFDDLEHQVAWLPLAASHRDATGWRVQGRAPSSVRLRATVAPNERSARRGYWQSLEIDAGRPETAIELRVPVQDVVVHLGGVLPHLAQALRLRRTGDPTWAPGAGSDRLPAVDAEGNLRLQLGPGSYELAPWAGGPWQPLSIQVPGPTAVTASFSP